jgi:hypothetical protein
LTPAQVLQNFNAGVGERYYLLFDVSSVTGVSQAYIMMTASQYDSYSYLFYQPTFISLDPTVTASTLPSIPVQGIRIGINGTIPQVGQAYIPLSTTVTGAAYTPAGEVLSNIGTVIGLQAGPLTDQFFLTFDKLGNQTDVVVEAIPTAPGNAPGPVVADIGVKTFAQVNATLSALTSVPTTDTNVSTTYLAVQQQLPPNPTLEGFSSANQVGVAQLAIQYCNEMVNNPTYLAQVLPGVTLSAGLFSTQAGIDSVTGPLAAKVLASGAHQPAASTITGPTGELDSLVANLCSTSACTTVARVQAVTAAACATAFGSADMLIY